MRATLSIFLCLSMLSPAMASDWELGVDSDGIKVWTRAREGSKYKEAKGEAIISAPPEKVFSVIVSAETCKEWVFGCVNSYVIERPRPQDGVVYMRTNNLWPVSDRDAVFLAETTYDDKNRIYHAKLTQKNDVLQPIEGVVRIESMVGSWDVYPESQSQSKVVFWSHVEPGGLLPAALVNLALSNLHKNSLKSLRKFLKESQK
ncbi:MAG: hypothetical protein RLZZ488_2407 [Pseudomonadota bacterium]